MHSIDSAARCRCRHDGKQTRGQHAKAALQADETFSEESLQNTLNELLEKTNEKPGVLFSMIRLSISWAPFSPALNDTLALIGKDQTLHRIDQAIAMSTSS